MSDRYNYHFAMSEFQCSCCGENKMTSDFINKLTGLRIVADFPFIISSGYRCPKHNNQVSSTGHDGPHTTGRAADIRVYGKQALYLVERAQAFGFTGIGVAQKGKARFIHLDDLESMYNRPRPHIWSY